MGIPNDTLMENELQEDKRREDEAKQRERLERSLESGLEDSFHNIIVGGPMILRYFSKIREMSNDFCPFRPAFP